MISYVTYNPENGEIRQFSKTSGKTPIVCGNDDYLIVSGQVDVGRSYVDTNLMAIKARPELPLVIDKHEISADGVDAAIISLPDTDPNGAGVMVFVKIGEDRFQITDGVLEFSTIDPGTHQLFFSGTNYLDAVVEITAHEVPEA